MKKTLAKKYLAMFLVTGWCVCVCVCVFGEGGIHIIKHTERH